MRATRSVAKLAKAAAGIGLVMLLVPSSPTVGETVSSSTVSTTMRGGVTYVTATHELPRGEWSTFRAPCPAGTQVLGGGFWNDGDFSNAIGAHSYPYDGKDSNSKPDDGWAAMIGAFGRGLSVKVYAMCANLRPIYLTRTESIPPRDWGPGLLVEPLASADPGCPDTAPHALTLGSRGSRNLQAWEMSPHHLDNLDNEPRSYTLIGICLNVEVENGFESATVRPRTQNSMIAYCPADTPIVIGGGGGFPFGLGASEDHLFASGVIVAAKPYPASGGWAVGVDNFLHDSQTFYTSPHCIAPLN